MIMHPTHLFSELPKPSQRGKSCNEPGKYVRQQMTLVIDSRLA